jgi:glycerol-3-phosphate acyltransferase PlsY
LGYLLGGIPFGLLVGLARRVDVRRLGSGNIGFSNVYRSLGPGYGVATLILDGLKGFLPTLLAPSLGLYGMLVGVGAILGHIFSPYLRLKGGKGVATTFGVLLALAPLSFGCGVAVWFLVVFISSYASVASLSFACALPMLILLARYLGLSEGNISNLIFGIGVALVLIYMHRSNIRRLLQHREPKFRFKR